MSAPDDLAFELYTNEDGSIGVRLNHEVVVYTPEEQALICAEFDRLRAENAKLREYAHRLELENIRLDSDNCDLRGEMEPIWAENAKLRELVHALHWCKDYEQQKCYMCPLDGELYHRCDDIARELGIEVN